MASDTSYTTSDVLSDDRIPSHYPSTTTTNDETTNNFKQSIKMSTSTQPNQITTTPDSRELWAESVDSDARFAQQLESLGVTYPEGDLTTKFFNQNNVAFSNISTSYNHRERAQGKGKGKGTIEDYKEDDDRIDRNDSTSDATSSSSSSQSPSYALVNTANHHDNNDNDHYNNNNHFNNHYNNNDDDGTTRALLVQNQRLVARVKLLEETLEKNTTTYQQDLHNNRTIINNHVVQFTKLENKLESEMQHKNQVVLSCEKMVVDRVKRSTILHLNTRDLLNNEIKILKQNLKKEIEMKHRERGQLEGRIISLETLLTKNKNKRVELENKLNENEKKRLLEIDVYTIDRNEYELRETLHFQDMLKCQTLLNNLQSCYQQTNNETTDTLFALANEANRVVANHPLSRFNGDNGLGGSGYRYSDTTTTATTTAALNTAATTSTTSTTSTISPPPPSTTTTMDNVILIEKTINEHRDSKEQIHELEIEALRHQLKMTTIHWERRVALLEKREKALMLRVVQAKIKYDDNDKNDKNKEKKVETKSQETKTKTKRVEAHLVRKRRSRRRKKSSSSNQSNQFLSSSDHSSSEDGNYSSTASWSLNESEIVNNDDVPDQDNKKKITSRSNQSNTKKRRDRINRAKGAYKGKRRTLGTLGTGTRIIKRKNHAVRDRSNNDDTGTSRRSLKLSVSTSSAELSREIREKGGFERTRKNGNKKRTK